MKTTIQANEMPDNTKAILLIGEPGSGKSYLISQMPKPLLVLDFDGKAGYTTYSRAENAKEITVISFTDTLTEASIPCSKIEFDEELNDLLALDEFPYKTVALDSLSSFAAAVLRRVVRRNILEKKGGTHMGECGAYSPTQTDYGVQLTQIEYTVTKLLQLPCTVVVAAHEQTVESASGAELYTVAAVVGKRTFAKALPRFFSEMWRTERYDTDRGEAKLRIRCQGNERYAWCCSKSGLPQFMPNNWVQIEKEMKQWKKEEL